MSRTVHLLKFWKENQAFMESVTDKNTCVAMLKECGESALAETLDAFPKDSYHAALKCGKLYDQQYKRIVVKFNTDNNIINNSDLYKGLSLPRLKILMALMAQDRNVLFRPAYSKDLNLSSSPKRFDNKFSFLLVYGFWFLGSIIEDSLSDDPEVNCGNPFQFVEGDLGYWWAGVVMLDWLKYIRAVKISKKCQDFYKNQSIKRLYKYNQASAMSHLDRIPQQFLKSEDKKNFKSTIKSVKNNIILLSDRLNQMQATLQSILNENLKIE